MKKRWLGEVRQNKTELKNVCCVFKGLLNILSWKGPNKNLVPLLSLFLHSFSPSTSNLILRGWHMKFTESWSNVAALKIQ